jgi:hypothetical protein
MSVSHHEDNDGDAEQDRAEQEHAPRDVSPQPVKSLERAI